MEVGRRTLVVPFGPTFFGRRPSARWCVDRFKLRAAIDLQLVLAFDELAASRSFLHCEASLRGLQPYLSSHFALGSRHFRRAHTRDDAHRSPTAAGRCIVAVSAPIAAALARLSAPLSHTFYSRCNTRSTRSSAAAALGISK